MTTTPPEAPPPSPDPAGDTGPRVTREEVRDLGRLRRSVNDRKVAGVAGGLGRHLDVDPLILRVAFVVLAFFGGAGIILYIAGWLLVPEEGSVRAPFNLDDRTRSVALVIVGVLASLALIGDSWGAFGFPWPIAIVGLLALWILTRNSDKAPAAPGAEPTPPPPAAYVPGQVPPVAYVPPAPPPPRTPDPRKRGPILFWVTLALAALAMGVLGIADLAGANVAAPAYPATALAICGVMLVVGSFFGRAGGIIAVGVLAIVGLVASTAADKFDASRTERPLSAAEVEARYSTNLGELRIDLTDVTDLEALDGRTIEVDGGVGSIDVTLPEGVRAEIDAEVNGAGTIKLFGSQRDGFGVEDRYVVGSADDPTITLDLALNVGSIEVTH